METRIARVRLLAFGNTLLRDDGVAIHAARALRPPEPWLEIIESEIGGLALLELLGDCDRALLLDAVSLPSYPPGALVPIPLSQARCSSRLAGVHEADLPTVLALASRLGRPLPRLRIFGIQGVELTRFGEQLTFEVAAALPQLVAALRRELVALAREPATPSRGVGSR